MITYLIILVAFFILNYTSFIYERKSFLIVGNKKIDLFFYFFVMFIFLFSAFRYDVGWDYNQYYWTIIYNLDTNIVSRGEFLTISLIELSRYLGVSNIYFFVNSLITIFLITFVIDKNSDNKWISILIFVSFPLFFLNSFSVIRFFTALAVIFFSVKYILEKKFFKYIVATYIASLFHGSAILAIVLYFFAKQRMGRFRIIIFTIISFLSSDALNFFVVNFFSEYAVYTEKTHIQEGTLAIYFFILILVLCFFIIHKINQDNRSRIFFNLFFFGVLIYIAFLGQGSMSHRLSLYGTIFSILLVPKIIEIYFKDTRMKIVVLYIVYVFLSLIFIYSVDIGSETYIPYRTIFSQY